MKITEKELKNAIISEINRYTIREKVDLDEGFFGSDKKDKDGYHAWMDNQEKYDKTDLYRDPKDFREFIRVYAAAQSNYKEDDNAQWPGSDKNYADIVKRLESRELTVPRMSKYLNQKGLYPQFNKDPKEAPKPKTSSDKQQDQQSSASMPEIFASVEKNMTTTVKKFLAAIANHPDMVNKKNKLAQMVNDERTLDKITDKLTTSLRAMVKTTKTSKLSGTGPVSDEELAMIPMPSDPGGKRAKGTPTSQNAARPWAPKKYISTKEQLAREFANLLVEQLKKRLNN